MPHPKSIPLRRSWWISGEERDIPYKPNKKASRNTYIAKRQSSRTSSRRVDYTEQLTISSGEESDGTVINSESGFEGSVKLELVEQSAEVSWESSNTRWTPGTIKSRTVSLTDQITRLAGENREITIAQETEQGGIE